jgi:hypothetical protein
MPPTSQWSSSFDRQRVHDSIKHKKLKYTIVPQHRHASAFEVDTIMDEGINAHSFVTNNPRLVDYEDDQIAVGSPPSLKGAEPYKKRKLDD